MGQWFCLFSTRKRPRVHLRKHAVQFLSDPLGNHHRKRRHSRLGSVLVHHRTNSHRRILVGRIRAQLQRRPAIQLGLKSLGKFLWQWDFLDRRHHSLLRHRDVSHARRLFVFGTQQAVCGKTVERDWVQHRNFKCRRHQSQPMARYLLEIPFLYQSGKSHRIVRCISKPSVEIWRIRRTNLSLVARHERHGNHRCNRYSRLPCSCSFWKRRREDLCGAQLQRQPHHGSFFWRSRVAGARPSNGNKQRRRCFGNPHIRLWPSLHCGKCQPHSE